MNFFEDWLFGISSFSNVKSQILVHTFERNKKFSKIKQGDFQISKENFNFCLHLKDKRS